MEEVFSRKRSTSWNLGCFFLERKAQLRRLMEFKKVSYNQIYNIRQRVGFRSAEESRVGREEKRALGKWKRIGRSYVGLGMDYLN